MLVVGGLACNVVVLIPILFGIYQEREFRKNFNELASRTGTKPVKYVGSTHDDTRIGPVLGYSFYRMDLAGWRSSAAPLPLTALIDVICEVYSCP